MSIRSLGSQPRSVVRGKTSRAFLWMWPFLPLFLIFSACAVNGAQSPPAKQEDGSEPNLASIYYNLSASYFFYEGDYLSASELYQRSLHADEHSSVIRKQILTSDANAYLAGQADKEHILQEIAANKELIASDEKLLSTAYSVYQQAETQVGMEWAADSMISSFPSPRAYILRFLADYQSTLSANERYLQKAYKLAQNKPKELFDLARIYGIVNLSRGIDILNELIALEPQPEAQNLLAEFLLRNSDTERASDLFRSYRYPTDKQQMLSLLQSANKSKSSVVIIGLEPEIIRTADANLLGELAFAAYLEGKYTLLESVYGALSTKIPEPKPDAKVAVFLVAGALDSPELTGSERFLPLLQSAQDADDVLLYRSLSYSLKAVDNKTEILDTWVQETETRLPDGPWKDYLMAATRATTENDSILISTRLALCTYLCASGKGYDSDYSVVLTDLHTQGRFQEKFGLLRIAMDKFPTNPLYLNDLGYSLLDFPDSLSQAGTLISRAVELEPNNAYYQDSIAWYHYLAGDYAKAMEHIQIPLQMENMPSEIAYHIGMILVANNNPTLAKEYFQMAAQDDTSPAYQQKAKAEIQRFFPGE